MNELSISVSQISFEEVCLFIIHHPQLVILAEAKEKIEKCRQYRTNAWLKSMSVSIELMTAAQGLTFRRPEQSSDMIENLTKEYRSEVSFNTSDRIFHNDIMKTIALMQTLTL